MQLGEYFSQLGDRLGVSSEMLLVIAGTAGVLVVTLAFVVPRSSEASRRLNDAAGRRLTRSMYRSDIYKSLEIPPDDEVKNQLQIKESYERNSRGIEIFSKSWQKAGGKPKAAIFFCHGYGDTCTFFFEVVARKLAAHDYAVYALDHSGFGLSEGLHGYIPSFDQLVADAVEHFSAVKKQEAVKDIPHFLMGQSMGGAVALKAHVSMPIAWDGAVLVAPLCKIAEEMTPPWYMVGVLKTLAYIIPKAKLTPSEPIVEIGFREPAKRRQAEQNLIAYKDRPRLGTALSLLRATQEIERELEKVSLPLLILHGGADRVTDPAISQVLSDRACSPDKTMHLYEGSWHALLEGEPDETIDKAIRDIAEWLDAHC